MTKQEREEYRLQLKRSMKEIGDRRYGVNGQPPAPASFVETEAPKVNTPTTVERVPVILKEGEDIQYREKKVEAPPVEPILQMAIDAATEPQVKIPKTVAGLIGQTFANVKVLSYNAEESLIPRGEKQKPLPHVDCKCLKCGSKFVVNAYRVSGGSQKSCGCDSKRKVK